MRRFPALLEAKRRGSRWLIRCLSCSRGPMSKGPMQQHLMSEAHGYTIKRANDHMEAARWVTQRVGR